LPEYLHWVLNSEKIQNFLQSKQVGTTTFSIRKETLQNLEIPIPPAHEQAQLIKLARVVEANTLQQQKIITNNQQLMNGITQQLFKTYGSNTHG
jgi:restriction endonuclease S subunit